VSDRRRPYGLLFDTVLTRVDAERAHHAGVTAIATAGRTPLVAAAAQRVSTPRDPVLRVHALGRELPGPLGLAAGFDKDAGAVDGLAALGFGFVEVGTVTAQRQPGNPRPRLVRLPADRAVVNRMGFNNAGAAAVAERLRRRREQRHLPVAVGVNVGRTKVATDAIRDLVASTTALAPYADYLVLNVSSPNTPGLRDLQAVDRLRPLLVAVRVAAAEAAFRHVPLLVKIAPDLADDDVRTVADLALELDLAGIVATNTTVSREGLASPPAVVAAAGSGGLSGPVLAVRSLEVLRLLRARVGDRLALVSVGGVWTGADAYARIRAGATLVQGYTAFVYEGPRWPVRVHRELAALLRRDGFTRVVDAVGVDAVRAGGGST
jgi:dihydroorotate dehydrogenase